MNNIIAKNIIVTICVLVIAAPVFAQIPKGSSTVGGNISWVRQKVQHGFEPGYPQKSEYKISVLSITPSYGYFIVNNLCVGANVNTSFGGSTTKPYTDLPELKTHTRSLGAGPMVRYYLPLDSKLYAYATASYTWVGSKFEYESFDEADRIVTTNAKSHYTLLDAGLGLSYFINPGTALEAGFAYTHAGYKDDNGNTTQKTNVIALNIGFRIFLRKA